MLASMVVEMARVFLARQHLEIMVEKGQGMVMLNMMSLPIVVVLSKLTEQDCYWLLYYWCQVAKEVSG